MKGIRVILATAIMLSPALASAQTAPPGQGYLNGTGYWHTNSGNANGQPGASCEDAIANNTGATPGNASSASGSAFNPDGTAGSNYAGNAPQNSRNTASVSQYDQACTNQTPG